MFSYPRRKKKGKQKVGPRRILLSFDPSQQLKQVSIVKNIWSLSLVSSTQPNRLQNERDVRVHLSSKFHNNSGRCMDSGVIEKTYV